MLLKRTMQIRWSKAMGVGLALSLCACASAQISLTSAVDLALRSNPKVLAAQASVTKAEAALAQTRDPYIPTVGVDGGYGKGTGAPSGLPTVIALSSRSLLFNFSQQDYVRAATSGLQAANLSLQETRDQVAEDVVVTYLNLDNAQRRQAALNEEYGFATRLVTIVQTRLNAGQDTPMDLLHARLTASQIRESQLHTDDDVSALSDHLARLIGLPERPLVTVPDSIPAMPPIDMSANNETDSFGIKAAFASARSKQETAFGDSRYRFRPQISFGADYSRIDTSESDFLDYYPQFGGKSDNTFSVEIQITLPIFDRSHEDHARETAAEAHRARFEAEDQRNQFMEGRLKLRHSLAEIQASSETAEIQRDIAQGQLDAILVQLNASSGDPNKPQMTPKDEQNARLQASQRSLDLLNAQLQLRQAQVNLLRQTGQLDEWLKIPLTQPAGTVIKPLAH
ncbi:TolC family protein [Granulicella mallensis]|uniref:Outer membrane protein TolC n=1 Tax=Granulicella mallensis TaxID=940614 RepID=A0A7W7ZMW0_9BACT|nr:TolC family protein [Granulicella mallensis]MBB5062532.1 outer membrane protein TolC [Granulicella mallensis]